jgi:hypothetical protein
MIYDAPDTIADVGFFPPSVAPPGLLIGFGMLTCTLMVLLRWKRRFEDWTPIPDVDDVEGKLRH